MKFRSQGIKKLFPVFFLAVLTFTVFRAWFTVGAITSGDLPFYFRENLNGLFSFPHLWDGQHIALLFLYPPIFLTGLLSKLGLGFALVERFVWFWLFLVFTVFSSWYLVKTLLPKNVFWFFCPFVFLFNTYILMIIDGGQMGIAMAYAVAPLVLGLFIKLINYSIANCELRFRKIIMAGVVLAIQVMFDPRISFLTMGAVFLYAIFQYGVAIKKYIRAFVLPLFIVLGLHFYWLLPTALLRRPALPAGYGEPGWVEFLSFARFSDSVSLLHPNWSENIFGKTYFFRPEFLILPILAFSSLLFINYSITNYELRIKKNVLVFALLGIVGAFLAKGANPPFGEIYLWLFKNFPGMNLFRDASKFYVLVALSYSILIPFSVEQIYLYLRKKFNN